MSAFCLDPKKRWRSKWVDGPICIVIFLAIAGAALWLMLQGVGIWLWIPIAFCLTIVGDCIAYMLER